MLSFKVTIFSFVFAIIATVNANVMPLLNHNGELVEETLQYLDRKLTPDTLIISIAGKTRSGKTMLFCNLFNEFCELTDTPDPDTVGVDSALVELNNQNVLALDTAGWFGPDHSQTKQKKLFAFIALISDVIIYNTIRNPGDTRELEELGNLAKQAELIRLESWFLDRGVSLTMPKLYWLVQNFDFKHSKDPKHYLHKYLEKYSKEFYSLENVFSEIDCGSLPTPCAPNDLGDKSKLSRKYLKQLKELKLSLMNSKPGNNFVELVRFVFYLVEHSEESDLDQHKIKEIRKRIVKETAWRTATQYFQKVIDKTPMLPTKDLNKQLILLKDQCIELFKKHLLGQEISPKILEKLQVQLKKFSDHARTENSEKIRLYLDELVTTISNKAKEYYHNLSLPIKEIPKFDENHYLEKHLNKKYTKESNTKIAFRRKNILLLQHFQDCQTRNQAALIKLIQTYGEKFVKKYNSKMQMLFIDKHQPTADLGSTNDKAIKLAFKVYNRVSTWIQKHPLLKSDQKTRFQEISVFYDKFKDINNQRIYTAIETFVNKHMIKFQKLLQGINLPDEDSIVDKKAKKLSRDFRVNLEKHFSEFNHLSGYFKGLEYNQKELSTLIQMLHKKNLEMQKAVFTIPLEKARRALGMHECEDFFNQRILQAKCLWPLQGGFVTHAEKIATNKLMEYSSKISRSWMKKTIHYWIKTDLVLIHARVWHNLYYLLSSSVIATGILFWIKSFIA